MRDYPDTKYAEQMEFLSIQAQYLYAKNSFENRQVERYNEAIAMFNEFVEQYPSSKYLKQAQAVKKDSERSIVAVQKTIAAQQPKQEKDKEQK